MNDVIQKAEYEERVYNVFTRLLKERIIFVSGEINDKTANTIIAQLLHLQAEDPNADITMYINSPGGSVIDGLAIYDTMNYISCDVTTICVGCCASMAAILLSSGTKGKRYALKNSEIMIHQTSSSAQGTVADMTIEYEHLIRMNDKTKKILSINTGQPLEKIMSDTNRNYWLSPEQALDYGIIDQII